MLPTPEVIAATIDASPLNRGLKGADWLASEGNIPVTFPNGDIVLFDDEGDGDYQVHFLFISRGREAIDHARKAFRVMFAEYGAKLIFGLVPAHLPHAKLMARWVGGHYAGRRDTPEGPCDLFVLSNTMFYRGALS